MTLSKMIIFIFTYNISSQNELMIFYKWKHKQIIFQHLHCYLWMRSDLSYFLNLTLLVNNLIFEIWNLLFDTIWFEYLIRVFVIPHYWNAWQSLMLCVVWAVDRYQMASPLPIGLCGTVGHRSDDKVKKRKKIESGRGEKITVSYGQDKYWMEERKWGRKRKRKTEKKGWKKIWSSNWRIFLFSSD